MSEKKYRFAVIYELTTDEELRYFAIGKAYIENLSRDDLPENLKIVRLEDITDGEVLMEEDV